MNQQPNYQMPPPPPPTATPKKGRSNGMALFLAICVAFIPGLVVIGGILAAIAIPNFMKFQGKAKQAEAKSMLRMYSTGEHAFISQWSVATTDMQSLGLQPDHGQPKYHYGFSQPAVAQWETIGVDANEHDASRSDTQKTGAPGPELPAPFAELAAKYCADCVAEGVNFKMIAIGNIDQDETLDVWTMDQDQQLEHVVDDVVE